MKIDISKETKIYLTFKYL